MIGTIDQAAMQLRTVALAAYTQELTYSDADGVDLTLAIEDEIIDASNGLATRVVNGLTGILARSSSAGCSEPTRVIISDEPTAWADKRSCRQCQGPLPISRFGVSPPESIFAFQAERSQPQSLIKGEVAASSMR